MDEVKKAEEKRPLQGIRKRRVNPLYNEIFTLLFLGFSVFLTLCVYSTSFGGSAGEYLKEFLFGVCGIGAMILPPVMVYCSFNKLFMKRKYRKGQAVWGICAFLCLVSLTHAISRTDSQVVYSSGDGLTQAYFLTGSIANGGVAGGTIGDIFYNAMGRPGAIITLFTALTAACVLFSGHSLSGTTRTVFSYVYYFAAAILSSLFVEGEQQTVYAAQPVNYEKFGNKHIKVKMKPSDARPRLSTPAAAAAPPTRPAVLPKIKRKINPQVAGSGRHADDRILLAFEDFQRKRPVRAMSEMKKREISIRPAVNEAITVRGLVGENNAESAALSHPGPAVESGPIHSLPVSSDKEKRVRPLPEKKSVLEKIPDPDGSSDWIDDLLAARSMAKPFDDFDPPEEAMSVPKVYGQGFDEAPNIGMYAESNVDESDENENMFVTSGRRSVIAANDDKPLKSMSILEGVNDADIYKNYKLPPIEFLNWNPGSTATESRAQILDNSYKLEETLRSFKVEAKVVEVSVGPTVTRYEMAPGPGVKVSSIASLSNDLALGLAAAGIRIEAPIPGKSAVGIEIPNKDMQPVYLREIIEDGAFKKFPSKLAFAVGKDIAGNTVVADVIKMPHLLIAGATGSGKSVCINTLIASILYKSKPNEVKLLMVDPKVVELSVYNGIPHLLAPVVTDCKKASAALNWAVSEMDIRYNLFAEANVRDLKSYNAIKSERGETDILPLIVIIIDELADLMMVAKGEIEELICRLAQKARAAGLHLIIATQRPSVDVITGLIKANIPSRLAFSVSSGTDSRTVLDMTGAEKLLGKGDMLFLPAGLNKPVRIQCGFISDREVEKIVDFLKDQNPVSMDQEMAERVTDIARMSESNDDLDQFYNEAVEFLISRGKGSASMLQRQFRIGYNRASRLIEELEARGVVGPEDGSKPRKVLITMEQWRNSQ
ncbi:MAG: DNA translocase FtsK [Clostridiales bacterium]|jgi:S-DNA-T family DNA segregation ATPase FtsK/SpoIIIE|nr:DNA translocase FtsK [Clostridiales bacterium]